MSSESLTQKWLRQNVQPYTQRDRVYSDIDSLLSRFSTLRPKSDIYTYDDGRTQLLLCIHGLLPISYRQTAYNIPISVWIPREYPKQPPIAYVVPTNDMLVKAGKYVEVSGKCQIEYIQHWERKSEGCNLSALLEAMQDQFSREPPVYAKPRNAPPARPQSTPQHNPNQPPTVSTPSPTIHNDRPLLPPKPGSSAIPPRPPSLAGASNVGHTRSPPQPQSPPLANRPPPPLPHAETRPPQYVGAQISSNYHTHPMNTSTSGSAGPSSALHERIPPGPNQRWSTPPQAAPVYQSPPPQGSYSSPRHFNSALPPPNIHTGPPLPPPPPQPPQVWSPPPAPQPPLPVPNLLDEEALESQSPAAPQVSPSTAHLPPRPPNPELLRLHTQVHGKFSSELASLSHAMALDSERLRAHQSDLLSGEPAIRDEMARLEAVRDVCRTVAGRMRGAVEQGERNVAELKRKGDPEVDELVCSTTIVHNQLINLVAEDNAIEDTIYHLHRALNTGRVDLERFLRTTRVLAEEQFMKRALIEKIQAGMPMGMSTASHWS